MITSSFILSCYEKDPKYFYRVIKRIFPDHYQKLESEYGSSVAGLYVIVYGEESRKCSCGNIKKFKTFRDGFSDYCSHSCYAKASEPKEKRKKTTIERFGVENCHQSAEVRLKFENTMTSRYGSPHALQNKEMLEKAKTKFKTHNTFEIQAKARKTTLERWGVEHATQSQELKNRIAESNKNKIGETTPLKKREIIEATKEIRRKIFLDRLLRRCEDSNIKPLFESHEFTLVSLTHPWLCLRCNNEFQDHMDNGILPQCPICYPIYDGASKGESQLRDFIGSLVNIRASCFDIIPPKEIDIFVPEKNIAFEYNGFYWHSEEKVKRNYHVEKTNSCAAKNIRLIHVFENEWILNQEIVKSRILSILGLIKKKIYARKCKIIELSKKEHDDFMKSNHIQGACISKFRYALAIDNEIQSVMSFGKSRYDTAQHELLRYANKLNTTTIGGASKLFAHFVKLHAPTSVVSYSDKRWNTGGLYKQLGFKFSHSSSPNYFYSKDGLLLESRLVYQKHKLSEKLEIFDPELSESANMKINGYRRIFDCGNDVFLWEAK